jgi:hypothetical protein
MKIFLTLFLLVGSFCTKAQIVLKGFYQGKNIYFQNPENDAAFCIDSIYVNSKRFYFTSNAAIEVKLDSLTLKYRDSLNIMVFHQDGCKPKILGRQSYNGSNGTKSIIDSAIYTNNGQQLYNKKISFQRSKTLYTIFKSAMVLEYTSSTQIDNNNRMEILSNNNKKSTSDTSNSLENLNAIAFFHFLPYRMKDQGVVLMYLNSTAVNGVTNERIKVRFDQENGGKAHDNEICLWFDKMTHQLAYFSTWKTSPCFMKVTETFQVNGITSYNYDVYEISNLSKAPENYDEEFTSGKARFLASSKLSNFVVE